MAHAKKPPPEAWILIALALVTGFYAAMYVFLHNWFELAYKVFTSGTD